MVILGLTGSIGMGKSTAAAMFRQLGVPVHDADAAVHALMVRGGAAVAAIEAAFPGVTGPRGAVDRSALAARVFGDDAALKRLEAIVHPLARTAQRRFLRRWARARVVVLDIPLLFETGGDARCDAVVVVTAPARVQRARVLARPGMTPARLAAILARQMPDAEKRGRADFVVNTGHGRNHVLRALGRIVDTVWTRKGDHWPPARTVKRKADA